MRWLEFALGLVVVSTTAAGLLATFVLPRGRSFFQHGPRLVIRSVYAAFVVATRALGSFRAKDSLLAGAGPFALLVQLGSFMSVFALGFTLVLVPWAGGFLLALREASAAVFSVGLAHATGPTNDVALVFAAAAGAITIALQIGYLPVIYQSYAARETLVALMESRAGVPAWGPELLARLELVQASDTLPEFYAEWEQWSAQIAESHGTYPVLMLFRSPEAGYSWLLSLLAVLDAAAMQLALTPSQAPSEARMCLRMGFTALRRLANVLGWHVDLDPMPDAPLQLAFADFASAVEMLTGLGFSTERSVEEAWPHFRGWRVNYESIAYRLADHLIAPHAPWSGSRRHLPPGLTPPNRPPHRSPDRPAVDQARFRNGV